MIQTGERRYHGDETNVFREYEKKYRLVLPAGVRPARAEKLIRESKADFSTVIDFVHQEHNTPDNQRLIREVEIDTHHHASNWFSPFRKAYTLESAPGKVKRCVFNTVFSLRWFFGFCFGVAVSDKFLFAFFFFLFFVFLDYKVFFSSQTPSR